MHSGSLARLRFSSYSTPGTAYGSYRLDEPVRWIRRAHTRRPVTQTRRPCDGFTATVYRTAKILDAAITDVPAELNGLVTVRAGGILTIRCRSCGLHQAPAGAHMEAPDLGLLALSAGIRAVQAESEAGG